MHCGCQFIAAQREPMIALKSLVRGSGLYPQILSCGRQSWHYVSLRGAHRKYRAESVYKQKNTWTAVS